MYSGGLGVGCTRCGVHCASPWQQQYSQKELHILHQQPIVLLGKAFDSLSEVSVMCITASTHCSREEVYCGAQGEGGGKRGGGRTGKDGEGEEGSVKRGEQECSSLFCACTHTHIHTHSLSCGSFNSTISLCSSRCSMMSYSTDTSTGGDRDTDSRKKGVIPCALCKQAESLYI